MAPSNWIPHHVQVDPPPLLATARCGESLFLTCPTPLNNRRALETGLFLFDWKGTGSASGKGIAKGYPKCGAETFPGKFELLIITGNRVNIRTCASTGYTTFELFQD